MADSLEQLAWDLTSTYGRIEALATMLNATERRGEAVAAEHIAAQIISVRERVRRLDGRR